MSNAKTRKQLKLKKQLAKKTKQSDTVALKLLSSLQDLPDHLKEDVINNLGRTQNRHTTNILALPDVITEHLQNLMAPHALATVLETLETEEVVFIPEDIREKIVYGDNKLAEFVIQGSTLVSKILEIEGQVKAEQAINPRLSNTQARATNLFFNNHGMDTITSVLNIANDLNAEYVTPLAKYAEQYGNLVDDKVVAICKENEWSNKYQLIESFHKDRISKFINI